MRGKGGLLPLFLTAALLAGCRASAGASPRPTESDPPVEVPVPSVEPTSTPGLTPAPEPDWAGLLAELQPEDIREIRRDHMYQTLTPEELAPLVRQAMDRPVEHQMRENGDDQIWSLHLTLWAEGDWRDGETTLYAGLEEDLVGVSLPGQLLWVEDQALYRLVRASMDTEKIINTFYYEKYRDVVDNYYDMRLEELREIGYVSWELTEFAGVIGTSKEEDKGITVFRVDAAFRTDPPELAPHRIAGGAYVDSELRACGLDWYPVHLVTIDGQAVGLTFDDWLDRYPGQDPLDHYTEEEIRELVANAHRRG